MTALLFATFLLLRYHSLSSAGLIEAARNDAIALRFAMTKRKTDRKNNTSSLNRRFSYRPNIKTKKILTADAAMIVYGRQFLPKDGNNKMSLLVNGPAREPPLSSILSITRSIIVGRDMSISARLE